MKGSVEGAVGPAQGPLVQRRTYSPAAVLRPVLTTPEPSVGQSELLTELGR